MLVVALARRFRGRGVEQQDLVQEGTLGLIRALSKFDYARGCRFATYASWWVRQAMQRAIQDQGRTIRLPASAAQKLQRIRQAERRNAGRNRPDSEEVARRAGLSPDNVSALRIAAERPASLEATWNGSVADRAGAAEPPDGRAERAVTRELTHRTLSHALAELPDRRMRRVLELHYGLGGDPISLKEIGELMGLTAARVCQLEKVALAALRSVPAADAWHDLIAA